MFFLSFQYMGPCQGTFANPGFILGDDLTPQMEILDGWYAKQTWAREGIEDNL